MFHIIVIKRSRDFNIILLTEIVNTNLVRQCARYIVKVIIKQFITHILSITD